MWKRVLKKEFPFAIGSPAIIWQILFFYLPILFMICAMFLPVAKGSSFKISLEHFKPLMESLYFKIMGSSFLLSFSTAAICGMIGYPLAYFLAFRAKKMKNLLLFLLVIPFWTNFLLHVYAWFFVLERQGFINQILTSCGLTKEPIAFLHSIFSVMLMMIYYYLPFMVLPIYFSLERLDPNLLEASKDLGATSRQTFRSVLLPLTMPAIRTGFFLVFIPAFGEFIIPELMGGAKYYFVGNVVSEYVLGNHTKNLGLAFTVLSCGALLISTCFFYLLSTRVSKLLRLRVK